MEPLYSKLYDKYTNLKRKKDSELDQQNKDQELKFINCLSAADEYVEYLRKENQKLRTQINDLKKEYDSISSTEHRQLIEYQNQLMEEYQKNKALSEEIEQLQVQKMQIEGLFRNKKGSVIGPEKASKSDQIIALDVSNDSANTTTRKRRKHSDNEEEDHALARELEEDLSREIMSAVDPRSLHHSECLGKFVNGDYGDAHGTVNCMYQYVLERLIGMKLSTASQGQGICLSAAHQPSGYSFSLTWREKPGKETQLIYHLYSLGTFERIAQEWMREDIMFSISMCPMFFQRLSRFMTVNCGGGSSYFARI